MIARQADGEGDAGGAQARPLSLWGALSAGWGLLGVIALLTNAVVRLAPNALEAVRQPSFGAKEWALTIAWCAFMAYSEGYRGFQRGFSPRVVVRAAHLARSPRLLDGLLAPFFCMGLFRASRRRLLTSWILVAMIALVILLVRQLSQPWRGMVDAGVVLGIAWGLVAVLVYGARTLRGSPPGVAADLPP